jgi:arachidonate 15-lipoxygenase
MDYVIPQHDTNPGRAEQSAKARSIYRLDQRFGFPITASEIDDNTAGNAWQLKTLAAQEKIRLNLLALKRHGRWNFINELPPVAPMKLARLLYEQDFGNIINFLMPVPGGLKDWHKAATLEDYRQVFALYDLPSVAERCASDDYFAELMVAGPDPTRLQRLGSLPAKFPITTEHLLSVPEHAGEDLATAMKAGRVYWVDYALMAELKNGQHPQRPKYMYAPMAAFAVPRGGGALRPFAIQTGQDPAGRQIYTPRDGYSWRLAKNCVLTAYNTCHEVLAHLGFTHMVSEAIMLASLRNLAPSHPLAVLLRRHFEGTQFINKLAVDILIQPNQAVEYICGGDLKSEWSFLADQRGKFSFRRNYLPDKFSALGTDSTSMLTYYPYRDDGLLIWHAIKQWVGEFVSVHYSSDADVRSDMELQAWAAEIASPDAGRLRDVGATPGQIGDRQDLIDIVTMTIWTAGPQHAVVNFAQKDHQTFVPANPMAGYTEEPRGTGHTEADWLANLPPLDVAVCQYCNLDFLGSVRHTVLGDYGHDFRKSPAAAAHQRFQTSLLAIEEDIIQRNARRPQPYEYLRPSLIPNSTNI